ncbi:MAG TPA: AIR carboxylase family protein, partial [Chthoniobacterales bacterium]|nr:AIR carboxylase family protein [Chthoniobacterales bacterium]
MAEKPSLVAVIMGSTSDWDTMSNCIDTLDELGIPNEAHVLSAHRTPDATAEFVRKAAERGIRVIIAAAGGAAHLAGVVAAYTWLPVLGALVARAGRTHRDAGRRLAVQARARKVHR